MIGRRFIDGDKLIGSIEEAEVGVRSRITSWLKRQPKAPNLIGRQRVAEILGVGSPYITVLVARGELQPVEVEGAPPVYDEAEVRAFAKGWKKRQRKKNAKAEA